MRSKVTLACVGGLLAALAAAGGLSAAREAKSSPAVKDALPATIIIGATSEKTGPVPVLGGESKGYTAAANWINSTAGSSATRSR